MKYSIGKRIAVSLLTACITFLLCVTGVLYSPNMAITDLLCQRPSISNPHIYVLSIDEKALERYGPWGTWSRKVAADVVNLLDNKGKPAVLTFDVLYMEEGEDAEGDTAFAEACANAGNVITAMNISYKMMPEQDDTGKIRNNSYYIDSVEYPYDALKTSAGYGFSNTIIDRDGYVRRAIFLANWNGEQIPSLAYATYAKYLEWKNEKPVMPVVDEHNSAYFTYSGKSGCYTVISLMDVLDGTVNPALFRGEIVLVGAYAVGLGDTYLPAISHDAQMHGVDIQANLVEALLEGKTQDPISPVTYGVISALITFIFCLLVLKLKTGLGLILLFVALIGNLISVRMLYEYGVLVPLIYIPVILTGFFALHIGISYVAEQLARKNLVKTFKKYVAPQVVDEIAKQQSFSAVVGGQKRHIAVLFVDIRGFTAMSEILQPEEVVEILNEFLELTTKSIFGNNGTLDKFMGDATMALFNAPFELDDYIYRAVNTAWEIKVGGQAFADQLQQRFGKPLTFGIGINCGDAIVGNIGSDVRMDYTAIGDTVNTAARLQTHANCGQILITDTVYEAVKGRVEVSPVGELSLKGKRKSVFVYQVDGVQRKDGRVETN